MLVRYSPTQYFSKCYDLYVKHEDQDVYLVQTYNYNNFIYCKICSKNFHAEKDQFSIGMMHLKMHLLLKDFNIEDFI